MKKSLSLFHSRFSLSSNLVSTIYLYLTLFSLSRLYTPASLPPLSPHTPVAIRATPRLAPIASHHHFSSIAYQPSLHTPASLTTTRASSIYRYPHRWCVTTAG